MLILKHFLRFCRIALFPEYNPLFDDWPLMGSPLKIFGILFVYLYFVKYAGPKFMKDRKPFELNGILSLYNIIQIVSNLCLALYVSYKMLWVHSYDYFCVTTSFDFSPKGRDEFYVSYGYFLLKLLDLLDTVFFVLRKKFKQTTFLHVYHHTIMFLIVGVLVRIYPGGHAGLMGLINSYVHFIMYGYYYLSSKNKMLSLKLKRFITQIQILQFMLVGILMLIPIVRGNCDYPQIILYGIFLQNLFMTFMFLDFYYKSYIKKINKNIEQKLE